MFLVILQDVENGQILDFQFLQSVFAFPSRQGHQ